MTTSSSVQYQDTDCRLFLMQTPASFRKTILTEDVNIARSQELSLTNPFKNGHCSKFKTGNLALKLQDLTALRICWHLKLTYVRTSSPSASVVPYGARFVKHPDATKVELMPPYIFYDCCRALKFSFLLKFVFL